VQEKIRKKLPEIKRDIKEFVRDESGFVSKDKILKAGFALGMASMIFAGTAAAHTSHTNTFSQDFDDTSISLTGSHTHHGQHTSY
jgi:hypothetical protein